MTSQMTARADVRDVARRAVKAEIASAAMRMFIQNGYDQTTVEQIAAEVGMTGRSIFRYFATKEDIVLGSMEQVGAEIAAALQERPAREAAWDALRHALDGPLDLLQNDDGVALARSTLLTTTPSLRAAHLQKHAQWTELLVPGVIGRLSGSAASPRLQARAIVASALACLDVAIAEWQPADGRKALGALLDATIAAVRRA